MHAAGNIVNLSNGRQLHHTKMRYRTTGWGNTWQQPGSAMGPVFLGFFCNCPETVRDFAVPFCLMLISVIFVVYYSYTLCLQMLSFLVLKIWENGQHPLAEHLPRSGTDGGSPSQRTRAGGKGGDLPSEHETNKKAHQQLQWGCLTEKLKMRKSEALPHLLPAASGTPMSPQHAHCKGPFLAATAACQHCMGGPRCSLNNTLMLRPCLNIHRILFFLKHISSQWLWVHPK